MFTWKQYLGLVKFKERNECTMKFKKKVIILISFIIISGNLILSNNLLANTEQFDTENNKSTDNAQNVQIMDADGYNVVAENDSYRLSVDSITTNFILHDKQNKITHKSNPLEADNSIVARDEEIFELSSLLSIEYYNRSGGSGAVMNTAKDSVLNNQFLLEEIDDGIRITYTIGDDDSSRVLPPIMSIEFYKEKLEANADERQLRRLQSVYRIVSLSDLSGTEYNDYVENYPALLEQDLYIIRDINDRVRREIEGYMIELGVTLDDVQEELNRLEYTQVSMKPLFTIPLELKIDDEGLLAAIKLNDIIVPDGYVLHKISFLKYFLSAGASSEGYLLIPDGAGSIIRFEKSATNTGIYSQRIYGNDEAITLPQKGSVNQQISMPVFGIKNNNTAIFSIIEEGESFSNIYAAPYSAGRPVYNINTELIITEMDYIRFNGLMNAEGTNIFSKESSSGKMQIRYYFLQGEDANYAGMAKCYRNYLLDRGMITSRLIDEDMPFYVELIGAVDKKKSIMGIPLTVKESLTTYQQAIDILKELDSAGINNINLRYSGWANGGMNNFSFSSIIPMVKLGGKSNLSELIQYIKENNHGFFPEADFVYVYHDKWFDGFSYRRDAIRFINKKVGIIGDYDNATFRMTDRNQRFIVSPNVMINHSQNFIDSYSKYNIPSVSLGSIGSKINSDFREGELIDRNESQNHSESILRLFSDNEYNIMVDYGNAYSVPYAGHIVNIPIGSSQYYIHTEKVLFIQMVLHGFSSYAGAPVNISGDYRIEMLKALEAGASIYYRWIYEDSSILKDTDYEQMFSLNYLQWVDQAVQFHTEINETLRSVRLEIMENHEMITYNVYKTTYSNGESIIVNYNNEAVEVENIVIEGLGFKKIGGGF